MDGDKKEILERVPHLNSSIMKFFHCSVFFITPLVFLFLLTGPFLWGEYSHLKKYANKTIISIRTPAPKIGNKINPLPFKKTFDSKFILRSSLDKSNLSNAEFTCFSHAPRAFTPCPCYMWDYGELKKLKSQDALWGYSPIQSIYEVTQLTFHKNILTYNARQKFRMEGVGSNTEPGSINFRSGDFNWTRKIALSPHSTANFSVVDSDPEFKNVRYSYSEGLALWSKFDSKSKFKEVTNLMRALFGLKSLSVNVTIGFSDDWPMVTSEISAKGIINGWTPPLDSFFSVSKFMEQHTNWCRCMKTLKGKLTSVKNLCFKIHSVGNRLQTHFDENLCTLEERLAALSKTVR